MRGNLSIAFGKNRQKNTCVFSDTGEKERGNVKEALYVLLQMCGCYNRCLNRSL